MYYGNVQQYLVWTGIVQPLLSVSIHAIGTPKAHKMYIYKS